MREYVVNLSKIFISRVTETQYIMLICKHCMNPSFVMDPGVRLGLKSGVKFYMSVRGKNLLQTNKAMFMILILRHPFVVLLQAWLSHDLKGLK